MIRIMTVDRYCLRCNNSCFRSKYEKEDKAVALPTSYIADATSFAMKYEASTAFGIKPSCAELQLVNLACAARDGFRRRAYLTVGYAAIIDELDFRGPSWLWRSVTTIPRLEFLKQFYGCPTAWEALDALPGGGRPPRTPLPLPPPAEPPSDDEDDDQEEGAENGQNNVQAPGGNAVIPPGPTGPRPNVVWCTHRGIWVLEEPTAAAALAQAAVATTVEEQQRAYVDDEVLHSTTTVTQGERPELVEPPGLEGGAASGARTARARFPQITGKSNYLHSNNPKNLQTAHDMRNIGIGVHNPLVSEARTRDLLLEQLKEKVFTDSAHRKALRDFESVRKSALPKKLSHDERMRAEMEAMNAAFREDGVGFDTVVKAFVKSEVTAKDKPRAIANHENTRLYALAKVAYVFEHVMFDVFRGASIKGRAKREAIEGIFKGMSDMRDGARFVENDLTAFEFGISEPLKQIEQEIFRHIARSVGVEESGDMLFDRVVEDRDKCATWRMTYRDSTGERRTAKIRIPQTMRESGDRVTSSGNFLQNLIAWFSFLVDPEHVGDALDALIRFRGAKMFYVSPRDTTLHEVKGRMVRRKYLACFAFEGDDTAGRFEERIWAEGDEPCPTHAFFKRWGWEPKLVWKPMTGDTYMRFVGYEALIEDNHVVYDGGEMVMTPEVRRLVNTKSWSTTDVTPRELKTCIRIYASTLAEGFKRVEPMHSFLQAVYDDNKGGIDVKAEKVREYYLAMTGELPEAGTVMTRSVQMPEFEGADPDKWKRLLRVSAGDFTDREWADMCHIGTIRMHGADLRTCVPASWRD